MADRQTLRPGTVLGSDYEIRGVLGQGGFGVTYEVWDRGLETRRALKEYFPVDMSRREAHDQIAAYSGIHNEQFIWGRTRFFEEGKLIARFSHPGIVKVIRLFEQNNTVYMVLDFVEGETLEKWARRNPFPPVDMVRSFSAKVLDALEEIHKAKVWHRDISPDNVMLRVSGDPVLIDFGAAKTELSTRTTTYAIVRKEYSPLEQLTIAGTHLQGPWTDVYALAATLYRLVTDRVPISSTDRSIGEAMEPASILASGRYPAHILEAIDWGLNLKARERPQSVAEWRNRILAGGPQITIEPEAPKPPPIGPDSAETEVAPEPPPGWNWRNPFNRFSQPGDQTAAANPPSSPASPDTSAEDRSAFQGAAADGRLSALRSYLTAYPQGVMRAEAERLTTARQQNRQIRAFTGHQGPVYSVAAASDGRTALSAGSDLVVRHWDLDTGQEIAAMRGHTRPIRHVLFLPDARFAVSAGDDRSARLWSIEQNVQVRAFDRHDSEVLALSPTADGLGIITGTRFRSVMRWDVNSGRALSEFEHHNGAVTAIAATPTGQHVLTGGQDRLLRLHAMPGLGLVRPLGQLPDGILSIAVAPDSGLVAVGCTDGGVYTWDLRASSTSEPRPTAPRHTLRGHDGAVRSVAFSADGRIILSGGRDGTLRLWRADTGQSVLVVSAHRDQVHAVASASSQGIAATASADGQVRLWDISDHVQPA